MRALALRDRSHPAVVALASSLGNSAAIDSYLRQWWVTVPDPENVEFISAPVRQLALAAEAGHLAGDCDDAATLAACLLSAIGWPCSLVAIRLHDSTEFSHVFARTVATPRGPSLDIDPIVPANMLPITNYAEAMEVEL